MQDGGNFRHQMADQDYAVEELSEELEKDYGDSQMSSESRKRREGLEEEVDHGF